MGLPTLDLVHNPISDEGKTNKWNVDPIQVPVGSVIRAWAKKFKEKHLGWGKFVENQGRCSTCSIRLDFHDSSFGII